MATTASIVGLTLVRRAFLAFRFQGSIPATLDVAHRPSAEAVEAWKFPLRLPHLA
jgi:hypothetical protein